MEQIEIQVWCISSWAERLVCELIVHFQPLEWEFSFASLQPAILRHSHLFFGEHDFRQW